MSSLATPFRYDFVGSFLRPEEVKKARTAFEAGKIDASALEQTEDEAISDLVKKKKRRLDITMSPMANSAAPSGIWIFSGD